MEAGRGSLGEIRLELVARRLDDANFYFVAGANKVSRTSDLPRASFGTTPSRW